MRDAFTRARSRELAAVHDGDPVRKREEFIDIFRDQQDCGTALARRQQLLMHIIDSAHIKSARRLVRQNQAWAVRHDAAKN